MKTINVMFVCHGNICRSPMAEFVFIDMVKKQGLSNLFHITSAATSREEIGNPPHHGTIQKLKQMNIPYYTRYAVQMTTKDYETYDYILVMDKYNLRNINRITGADTEHKVHSLLDFSSHPRDIADPWYTGDFDKTYDDIVEGCTSFLAYLYENNYI